MTGYIEPIRRVDSTRAGKPTHWYADANNNRVPGVTTIIGAGLPKPNLIKWASRSAAEYADREWEYLARLGSEDRVREIKDAPWNHRDRAATRGTELHALADKFVQGEEVEIRPDLADSVSQYARFVDEWQPEVVLGEATVYHLSYGFAGTIDLIARLRDGRTALIDLKTGKGVYGDVAYQLAAYRYAEKYLTPDGPLPMPEVDVCMVLHVRPDGYDLRPVLADQSVFREFRHIAEVARATKRTKSYLGEPIHPDALEISA